MSETASLRDLHSILDVERLSDLDFFAAPLAALFGQLPGELQVCDFSAAEDGDERSYRMALAVKETVWLELPGLDGFGLGVVRHSADEWPLIYCEVHAGGAVASLAIQHFPLTIEIANPLLEPVAVEGQAAVMEGFSFEIEGGFSVASDGAVSATLEAFSLPPFAIVGTGLVLALDNCRLIVRDEDVDAALAGLGFTTAFRGLHAASALLDWNVPLQLEGRSLPGIHAGFENVALGNQGVSFSARLDWPVVIQDGQFDESQTEVLGWFIDPDWRLALSQLQATVKANVPTAVAATGHLRVPLLDAVLDLEISSRYESEGRFALHGSLRTHEGEIASVPLGSPGYRLDLHGLRLDGRLDGEAGATGAEGDIQLRFSGHTACDLELPGLKVTAAEAAFEIVHAAAGEKLELELDGVDVDHVGRIDRARLHVGLKRGADGARTLERLELQAAVVWADLASRIALSQVPAAFPLPPDDAEVTLRLTWADDQLQLQVEAALADVDQLWRFVPAAQRPQVASAAITVALSVDGADFDGELGLQLRLRLPDLAALPGLAAAGLGSLVQVDSGDDQGWIEAEFKAELSSTDGTATGALHATLANPLSLAFNLPGLVLPRPPLEITVTAVALELSTEADQTTGEFRLSGVFALRPILPSDLGGLVPAPMAVHLERLFASAHLYDLAGTAALRLGQADDGAYLAVDCRFTEAGLEIDLFDMLAGAAAQMTGGATQGSEIDLDIEVSFALKSLALSVGQVPGSGAATSESLPFRFAFACELGFAGQFTDIAFELSHQSLSFGIVELALPVALPQLPLSRADLDALRDAAGRWDMAIWTGAIEPQIDARLTADQAALALARAQLEAMTATGADAERERFELRYRRIPALQKAIFHDTGKKFLTEAVLAVYQLLGQLSSAASQGSYQAWVELYQDAVDLTLGSLHFDTRLQFVISDAKFVLPFNDPSAIRVEGGASLKGFAPDDPLAPLQDLVFKLGLSADAIYFAVEGGADPIPLPSFGRYEGNAVELDRLVIGYGYSKNSLKVDFAGALQLSPALVDDADTSSRIGVGLRLPTDSRLQFKLDLIPVVLGEVDFLLPLIAFDVDLRSEAPLPPPAGEACAPAWDGLQLVAPGVLRAGFKRGRFGPFFGPLPAPNYLWAFDLAVGNDELGLTQVCDNYQVITPVAGTLPIPFLADNMPFFDRQCSSLRLAGFGIHFDLRRPFPHPSPLMIFELLGFLSDPTLPIDPAGHLAELMWAEMRNAQITLPPAVLGMFPEQGRALTRALDLRINVGTVIALGQHLAELLERIESELSQAGTSMADVVQRLIDDPPRPRIDALLDSLPRELRRVELNGSFVGFDASAVFLLISPQALRSGIEAPPAPPAPPTGMRWEVVVDEHFNSPALDGWRAVQHGLKGGQGEWAVLGGALVQTRNVGDNSPGRYGAMLVREVDALSDLRVTVEMRSIDDDGMGVVFHVQGDTSFYRFRMTAEQQSWHLMRLKGGVTKVLHETVSAFVKLRRYRVRIEARSVPQDFASLPAALDRGVFRAARRTPGVRRQASQLSSTHIRVWVDDVLWCDVNDADAPLTHGQVGLDSWWNQGVGFDHFKVERAVRGASGHPDGVTPGTSRDLAPLISGPGRPVATTTPATDWVAEDLAGFGAADLLQALPGDAPAVVVAARVRVFAGQTYRFLGVMQADGDFRLLTTASVAPLTLSVAGLEVGLAAQVQGRLLLEGRSAGADSWARVEASLFADWTVLPAPGGALARLRIGRADDPATLSLGSRGDFRLQGSGALHLFGDALVVEGAVDASDRHVFMAGDFAFAPALFISGSQRVLELALHAQGRLGPGRHFGLAGEGTLKLLGKTFSTVSGELTPDGVSLEARLEADSQPWNINGFALLNAQMALRGQVVFGAAMPALSFEGTTQLTVAGVQVSGQCRVAAGPTGWSLAAAGRLHWQGREWLQAAIELGSAGLTVQGQTSFALQLTPQSLPAGIELAGLVLSATVGGSLTVGATGRLVACRFHLDWTLAVRLPGQQAKQMLPIASQRLDIDHASLPNQNAVKLVDLITIDGLNLLPLDGITIPVPTVSTDGGTPIYLHTGVTVNPPAYSLGVTLLTPIKPSPSAVPDHLGFLYEVTPTIDLPAVALPIPVLSNDPPASNPNQDPLFTLPNIGLGQVPLSGALQLDGVAFTLELWWQDGTLGLKVLPGGQFHPFASLPAIGMLPVQLMTGLKRLGRG